MMRIAFIEKKPGKTLSASKAAENDHVFFLSWSNFHSNLNLNNKVDEVFNIIRSIIIIMISNYFLSFT